MIKTLNIVESLRYFYPLSDQSSMEMMKTVLQGIHKGEMSNVYLLCRQIELCFLSFTSIIITYLLYHGHIIVHFDSHFQEVSEVWPCIIVVLLVLFMINILHICTGPENRSTII